MQQSTYRTWRKHSSETSMFGNLHSCRHHIFCVQMSFNSGFYLDGNILQHGTWYQHIDAERMCHRSELFSQSRR